MPGRSVTAAPAPWRTPVGRVVMAGAPPGPEARGTAAACEDGAGAGEDRGDTGDGRGMAHASRPDRETARVAVGTARRRGAEPAAGGSGVVALRAHPGPDVRSGSARRLDRASGGSARRDVC